MGRLKRFALGVIPWLLVHSHLANADGIAQVYADSIDVRSISASSNISIGPARLNELSATDEIFKRMLFLNIFSSSPNALINASMDNAMQSVGGRISSVAQVSTGKRLTGFIPLSKSGDSFGIDIKIANGPSNLATTVVTGCSKKFFSSSPSLPSQCSECPPNTESMGFISSECYCSSGYYSGSDAECLPCPINGLCRGGPNATVEVARNGFAVVEGDANGALVAVPCPNKEACVKGTTGCVTGYTGSLCSQCSSGYYKAGPVCRECSLGNAPFIITAVVASIVVYIVFMGVTWLWERSASLSIVVFFLQDLAFLSIVEVQLPEATRLLLHQISFFNYNWELAQSECSFGQVPWYLSTVLILGMPVIFLFMDCLVTGSGMLVTIVRQRLDKPKLIEWSKWAYDIRPKNYLCFLHLSFFPFVLSSFSLFDCRSAGILSYVQYNTAAMCESHGPVGFVWLGIISTLIYGLGIPAATYYLVHRSSPPKPVSEPTFELTETGLSEKIKASSSLENSSADNRNLITKNQGGISLVSDPKQLLFTYVRRYGMIVLAVFHPENGVTSVQPLCIACWLFVVSFLQFYGVRRSQPRARNLIAIVEGLFIMWIHAAILLAVAVHFRYLYDDSYPLTAKSGGSVPLFNVLWWWILIGIILGALVFVVEIGYIALRTKGFIPDIFEVKEKEPESESSTPSGLGPDVNEQTLRFTKSVFGMSNASQSTLPQKVGEIERSSVKSEEKTIPTATSIQKSKTSGTIPSYSEQEAESVRAEASLAIDTNVVVSAGPETESTLANENDSSVPASCLDPTKEESVKDNDDTLNASKGSSKRSLVVEKEIKNEELHNQSTNLEMKTSEEIPVVESANVQEQNVTEPISESENIPALPSPHPPSAPLDQPLSIETVTLPEPMSSDQETASPDKPPISSVNPTGFTPPTPPPPPPPPPGIGKGPPPDVPPLPSVRLMATSSEDVAGPADHRPVILHPALFQVSKTPRPAANSPNIPPPKSPTSAQQAAGLPSTDVPVPPPAAPLNRTVPKVDSPSKSSKKKAKKEKQKQKKGAAAKKMISGPTDFKHVGHVGLSGGINLEGIPNGWKEILLQAGVTKEQLDNPDTRKFIFDFVSKAASPTRRASTAGNLDNDGAGPSKPTPPPAPPTRVGSTTRLTAPPPPPPAALSQGVPQLEPMVASIAASTETLGTPKRGKAPSVPSLARFDSTKEVTLPTAPAGPPPPPPPAPPPFSSERVRETGPAAGPPPPPPPPPTGGFVVPKSLNDTKPSLRKSQTFAVGSELKSKAKGSDLSADLLEAIRNPSKRLRSASTSSPRPPLPKDAGAKLMEELRKGKDLKSVAERADPQPAKLTPREEMLAKLRGPIALKPANQPHPNMAPVLVDEQSANDLAKALKRALANRQSAMKQSDDELDRDGEVKNDEW